MNYIEVNKKITINNLKDLKDVPFKDATMERCLDEYRWIKSYLGADSSILDIGARDGSFLEVLSKNGHVNLMGTDISPEAVQVCKDKGFDVFVDDMHDIGFVGDSFDFVSIIHVLEHSIDAEQVLREIHRILTLNGHVFIEVPIQKNEDPNDWGHFNIFNTPKQAIDMIGKYFKILKTDQQKTKSNKPWLRILGVKYDN